MKTITASHIQSLDSEGMWDMINDFPEQWQRAMDLTQDLLLAIDADQIENVCLAGMGGSATGADLIRAYSYGSCPHPVQVIRHYDIPAWVNKHTLFIPCSFSGNTEETLSALAQAREQGAQTIAVTSGGELMIKATKQDFDYIKIPGGMPPRASLGYNFVPLFRIFQHLGYLDETKEVLTETADYLKQHGQLFNNIQENEALSLAREISDTLPVIYSDAILMEPVNLCWRSQLEENAKTLAYGNTFPEMNHNEVVGWDQIIHLTGRLSVIMLRDRDDHPKVQQRMRIVEDLIGDQVASMHVLSTRGESRLTRLFSLIQLADWTSFYLAMLNGVDPTPITKIDLLKMRLADL